MLKIKVLHLVQTYPQRNKFHQIADIIHFVIQLKGSLWPAVQPSHKVSATLKKKKNPKQQ